MDKAGLLEMKSATITEKGQISIPKEVRKSAGLKPGSKVAILCYGDRVELRPMRKITEGMEAFLMSRSSLAKIWDTPEEDKAWGHL
jgi:AbrB family looped-hinge helix DNA binding protein